MGGRLTARDIQGEVLGELMLDLPAQREEIRRWKDPYNVCSARKAFWN